jgi:hypothetical protein
VFFFEKRPKKLLLARSLNDAGHGLDPGAGGGHKRLLLLFFRKEGLTS